jgi:hypothetical protein
MTIQLAHQILIAEHDVRSTPEYFDGRFTPSAGTTRELGARVIRAVGHQSLRLADRLDPGCCYA